MTVVVIISSVILPSSTVVVSVPIPFTITVAIPISFPLLVAVVTTTVSVTVSISFAVPSVLAVLFLVLFLVPFLVFFLFLVFSILRGLLAFTTGSGPAVLGGFFLAKTFLMPFDELGEGGPTSLVVFERLVFAQVLEEWYGLTDNQISSRLQDRNVPLTSS